MPAVMEDSAAEFHQSVRVWPTLPQNAIDELHSAAGPTASN